MRLDAGRCSNRLLTVSSTRPPLSFLRQTARGRDRAIRRLYTALATVQFGFYVLYTHPGLSPGGGAAASAWGLFTPSSPAPSLASRAAAAAAGGAAAAAGHLSPAPAPAAEAAGVLPGLLAGGAHFGLPALDPTAVVSEVDRTSDALISSQGDYSEADQIRRRLRQLPQPLREERADDDDSSSKRSRGDGGEGTAAAEDAGAGVGGEGGAAAEAGGGGEVPSEDKAAAATAEGKAASAVDGRQRPLAADTVKPATKAPKPAAPQLPPLTAPQRVLRATFYVWVSTANLMSASTLWARCADAFSADASAGARLFGFISAGATLGQLGGSVIALALATRTRRAGEAAAAAGAAAPSATGGVTVLVLLSAGLLLVAAQLAPKIRYVGDVSAGGAGVGALRSGSAVTRGQLQQQQQNLRRRPSASSGTSSGGVEDEGKGGGAAVGSSGGTNAAAAAPDGAGGSGSEIVSQPAGAVLPAGGRRADGSKTGGSSGGGGLGAEKGKAGGGGGGGGGGGVRGGSQWSQLLAGFRLVMSSEYLILICAYLLITYVVGSLMYFERALVVSKALRGAGERTTFFAWLNSW